MHVIFEYFKVEKKAKSYFKFKIEYLPLKPFVSKFEDIKNTKY